MHAEIHGACFFFTVGSENGQYLFLNSPVASQQTIVAIIQSETFPAASLAGRCLTFWYIIRGSALGRVDVNITTSQDTYMIWSLGGVAQGVAWSFASVGYYVDDDYTVTRSRHCENIPLDVALHRSLSRVPSHHRCKGTMPSMTSTCAIVTVERLQLARVSTF